MFLVLIGVWSGPVQNGVFLKSTPVQNDGLLNTSFQTKNFEELLQNLNVLPNS